MACFTLKIYLKDSRALMKDAKCESVIYATLFFISTHNNFLYKGLYFERWVSKIVIITNPKSPNYATSTFSNITTATAQPHSLTCGRKALPFRPVPIKLGLNSISILPQIVFQTIYPNDQPQYCLPCLGKSDVACQTIITFKFEVQQHEWK